MFKFCFSTSLISVSTLDLDALIRCCCCFYSWFLFYFIHFVDPVFVFSHLCPFCLKPYVSRNGMNSIESSFRYETDRYSMEIVSFVLRYVIIWTWAQLIQSLDGYYGILLHSNVLLWISNFNFGRETKKPQKKTVITYRRGIREPA